jgi:hypothetical protein
VIASLALAPATPAGVSSSTSCKKNYAYAGAQDATQRSGIRANLSMASPPKVAVGHVAGWVGVGGPGLGPNGTDEWLQAGYASLEAGPTQIYYEVTLPDKPPEYHTIKDKLSSSEKHLLSVLEVQGKNNSWKVWLDNKAVTPVITLPKSHNRFVPQALGETWNGGTTKCNHYAYRFQKIQISKAPGGSWAAPKAGYVWKDSQNSAKKTSSDSFESRSSTAHSAASSNEPPLLGSLASRLAGRTLSAECVAQRAAVREDPPLHLLLSNTVCERLLGYAVAQPYGPSAGNRPGFAVAVTVLAFLRGVARAAKSPADRVDCRAVGFLYRAARVLGATHPQALAFRQALLQKRATLEPKLALDPSCRYH